MHSFTSRQASCFAKHHVLPEISVPSLPGQIVARSATAHAFYALYPDVCFTTSNIILSSSHCMLTHKTESARPDEQSWRKSRGRNNHVFYSRYADSRYFSSAPAAKSRVAVVVLAFLFMIVSGQGNGLDAVRGM